MAAAYIYMIYIYVYSVVVVVVVKNGIQQEKDETIPSS
jgi:hypothetical protein